MNETETATPGPSRRVLWTSVLAATSVWVATAIGQVVELVLKATNPDDVDVTQPLAYLRPVLITTWALVVVAVVVTVAAVFRLGRTEGRSPARTGWTLFVVQLMVWGVFVAARAAVGPVVDG